MMRSLGAVRAALTVAAVGTWFAMRAGASPATPRAFSVLAALTILACVLHVGVVLVGLRRRERLATSIASMAFSAGVVLVGSAGLANWLMSIQGYVILSEGEAVPLGTSAHLGALEVGPLAPAGDHDVTIGIVRIELRPVEPTGFEPVTHLRVSRPGADASTHTIGPHVTAAVGALRLHQGAFGFAPEMAIFKGGRRVFQRAVPFRTQLDATGLIFEGSFEIVAEGLQVNGSVALDGLDDRMKGHPRLVLAVKRDGRDLGGGTLDPGHFAELPEGYRVGFVGMKRWSEIDVSRRTYSFPIWLGLGLIVLALLGWPVAVWRRW